jgi:hypothetical protein
MLIGSQLLKNRNFTNYQVISVIACSRQQSFEAFPALLCVLLTSEEVRNNLASTGKWNAPSTAPQ